MQWEIGGRAPLISKVGGLCRQSYSLVALPPGKQPPVTVEKSLGGASNSVWTLWRRKKCPVSSDNRSTLTGTPSL